MPPTYAPPRPYGPAYPQAYGPQPYHPQPYAPPRGWVPPPSVVPAPAPVRPSDSRQTISTGFGLFGASYVITAILGGVTYDGKLRCVDKGDPPRDCRRFGAALMIPAVGPFIAIGETSSEARIIGVVWSGVLQLAGLGLGIAGAVKYGRERRRMVDGLRLRRNVYLGSMAAGLQLRVRF